MKRPGFSLIETVLGLIIISLAFYSLIAVFFLLAPKTANVENLNKKIYLAQEKMEEYLARNFTSVTSVAAASFPAPFNNYQYQILVNYVATGELNTTVTGTTEYKAVKVRVWGGQVNAASTVELVSLVTTYEVR